MPELDQKVLQDLESIFSDMFGSKRARARDLTEPFNITLLEAAHGGKREVELRRHVRCETCNGRGGAESATFAPCAACAGKGENSKKIGAYTTTRPCELCLGSRGRWSKVCDGCGGAGDRIVRVKHDVNIPAGVVAGSMLRLAGQGNDLGEGPGDALLLVMVEAHDTLTREGDDLRTTLRLDHSLLREGGEATVPWLKGDATIRVPAGSAEGDQVRLRGWGCVKLGSRFADPPSDASPYRRGASERGDLVVTLTTTPEPSAPVGELRPPFAKRALVIGALAAFWLGVLWLTSR